MSYDKLEDAFARQYEYDLTAAKSRIAELEAECDEFRADAEQMAQILKEVKSFYCDADQALKFWADCGRFAEKYVAIDAARGGDDRPAL